MREVPEQLLLFVAAKSYMRAIGKLSSKLLHEGSWQTQQQTANKKAVIALFAEEQVVTYNFDWHVHSYCSLQGFEWQRQWQLAVMK